MISATTGSDTLGQLSNQLSTGLIRGYGRKHELEADRLGAQYLHSSGYNPEIMLEVIGVLKDQELYEMAKAKEEGRPANIYHGVYSTHPENDDRLQTVILAAKDLSVQTYRDNNKAEYLGLIDGMIWGQSPEQGVVIDNRFMHAELGIALQFPDGWKVDNLPTALVSRNPANSAQTHVRLVSLQENESLGAMLKRVTKNSALVVEEQNYGATARSQATISGNQQPARVSAIKLEDNQALFLAGTSSKADFKKTDSELLAINRSFFGSRVFKREQIVPN